MAGFKSSISQLNPDCFITFDGDNLFDTNGYLRYPFIPDMTKNDNNALVHAVSEPIKSYALGTRSLIPREEGIDQHSITFAVRGNIQDYVNTFPYPASKCEIMHSDTLRCEDEFTFSFVFKKTDRDMYFRNSKYDNTTGKYVPSNTIESTIYRTIFQKGDDVWMRWRGSYPSVDFFEFKFPGPVAPGVQYTFSYFLNSPTGSTGNDDQYPGKQYNILTTTNYTNQQIHVVMTRRKLKVGSALFQTVDTVYMDGIKYFERKSAVTNEPSTALNTSSIFIGGNQSVFDPNTLNDRQTTALSVDNFAVWNERCLTDDEVSWLYKKMYDFSTYTRRWDPQLYAEFSEPTINPNATQHTGTLQVNKRSCTLSYIGMKAQGQITPGELGPKRLITSPAIAFRNNGMARIINTSNGYNQPVLSVSSNQNWTLEMFVSFASFEKGVIFAQQSDVWPYKGILLEANMANGIYTSGGLQVSLEDGLFLSTNTIDAFGNPIRYNDGEFHHISIIRRNSMFEFWVDGVLQGTRYGNNGDIVENFGQVYMMGVMPDQNSVNGLLSNLVFFAYAMQPSNIRARSYFYTRTVVEGYVTLRGVPHPATVRCYERSTGNFIREGRADPTTGWYKLDVWTQNYMDVMFFDIKDPNVRPRSMGPYLAYEYTDIDDIP